MQKILETLKALADGNRLRAFAVLRARDELCVCQITEMLGLSMATVSRHMNILHRAGLVHSRKDGRWVFYCLAKSLSPELTSWLDVECASSPEIEADQARISEILLCDTTTLCKRQKAGKSRPA
jgi:ArsR family transcriptional regulator